jgi:hypothetical protein
LASIAVSIKDFSWWAKFAEMKPVTPQISVHSRKQHIIARLTGPLIFEYLALCFLDEIGVWIKACHVASTRSAVRFFPQEGKIIKIVMLCE